MNEDFTAAVNRLLPQEERAVTHYDCLLRIDEQIDFEPEGSDRMAALQQGRARFAPAPEEAA